MVALSRGGHRAATLMWRSKLHPHVMAEGGADGAQHCPSHGSGACSGCRRQVPHRRGLRRAPGRPRPGEANLPERPTSSLSGLTNTDRGQTGQGRLCHFPIKGLKMTSRGIVSAGDPEMQSSVQEELGKCPTCGADALMVVSRDDSRSDATSRYRIVFIDCSSPKCLHYRPSYQRVSTV